MALLQAAREGTHTVKGWALRVLALRRQVAGMRCRYCWGVVEAGEFCGDECADAAEWEDRAAP